MSDIREVNAIGFIRRRAIEIAKVLRGTEENPTVFIEHMESNIASAEDARASTLQTLWDARQTLTEDQWSSLPVVGSKQPQHLTSTNEVYDNYKDADTKRDRSFYRNDLPDALFPDIATVHEAMKLYTSKTKEKLPASELPKGFVYPEADTAEATQVLKLWAKRRSDVANMVSRAFMVYQIVERINSLPTVNCEITTVKDKDGNLTGYSRSPNPIELSTREGKVKLSVWSVSNVLLLARPILDAEGNDVGITYLDSAIAKGGSYDEITSVVKRERDRVKAAKAQAQLSYRITKPDEFTNNVDLVGEYFGIGLSPKEQAEIESKLVTYYMTKASQEELLMIAEVNQQIDSVVSKLSNKITAAQAKRDVA